jgi:hypothetical protein
MPRKQPIAKPDAKPAKRRTAKQANKITITLEDNSNDFDSFAVEAEAESARTATSTQLLRKRVHPSAVYLEEDTESSRPCTASKASIPDVLQLYTWNAKRGSSKSKGSARNFSIYSATQLTCFAKF